MTQIASSATTCRRPTSIDEFPGCISTTVTELCVRQNPDVIVGMLEILKQTDFTAAVDIAAHANQKLRDKLGNILTDIWSRNSSDAEAATGQLTSHEDIQTYMREMLKEHVDANKALLVKCDNDTLCTWILGFVTSWEQQYKKSGDRYDISENILSVMSETVQFVTPYLAGTPFDVDELDKRYPHDIHPARMYLPVLERDSALVRFYFRHPSIARYMVLVAGKLLQRRECNRTGVYCSTRQRNDVARELDRVVSDLKFKLRSLDRRYDKVADDWIMYAMDHKKLEIYSKLLSTKTPVTTPAASTNGVAV
jgi:hypothetical protein